MLSLTWCVVAMQVPIYAVSHRRGPNVHKFIATCGTTLPGGAAKAYFADDEERANANLADYEITRKAPRVLNDYTLAQPCLDRHNRYRQVIAAHVSPPSIVVDRHGVVVRSVQHLATHSV